VKRSETIQLFAVIKALYPRDEAFKNATKDMVDAWTEMLADIPFDHAKAAIKASVSTSPFPPSIAEIRDYATRLTGKRRMTAEEAWGQACDMIRQYGTRTVLKEGAEEKPPEYTDVTVECRVYRAVKPQPCLHQYEAELHCDPEVWKLLKNMGYKSVVESDAPDVVRGQFMRAWGLHDREATERRVLGGVLPEFVRMLGETMSLEGGKA
jgi:hypothetical protein